MRARAGSHGDNTCCRVAEDARRECNHIRKLSRPRDSDNRQPAPTAEFRILPSIRVSDYHVSPTEDGRLEGYGTQHSLLGKDDDHVYESEHKVQQKANWNYYDRFCVLPDLHTRKVEMEQVSEQKGNAEHRQKPPSEQVTKNETRQERDEQKELSPTSDEQKKRPSDGSGQSNGRARPSFCRKLSGLSKTINLTTIHEDRPKFCPKLPSIDESSLNNELCNEKQLGDEVGRPPRQKQQPAERQQRSFSLCTDYEVREKNKKGRSCFDTALDEGGFEVGSGTGYLGRKVELSKKLYGNDGELTRQRILHTKPDSKRLVPI